MKEKKLKLSRQNLTRCLSCSRHQRIDPSLSGADLLLTQCVFCGDLLIGAQSSAQSPHAYFLGARSSKLEIGLLGTGVLLSGCESDETIVDTHNAGMQTAEMKISGNSLQMKVLAKQLAKTLEKTLAMQLAKTLVYLHHRMDHFLQEKKWEEKKWEESLCPLLSTEHSQQVRKVNRS